MDAPAYDKLLRLLDTAQHTLASHAGNLNSADLRIRCLVNITAKETERALREAAANIRTLPAEEAAAAAAAAHASASPGAPLHPAL